MPGAHPCCPSVTVTDHNGCGLSVVCGLPTALWITAKQGPTSAVAGREGGIRTRGLSVPNAAR